MVSSSLRTVSRQSLSDEVAWQIEFAIKGGRFKPGEKLPSERVLSQELGVSRPILRQALQILEIGGLVDIQHGRGTFVVSLANEFVSPIKWLNDHKESVRAFYEARMVIEPACASLAARRASPKQIAELRINVNESGRVAHDEDILSFVALDIEFHSIVARLSGNPHLYRALELIINPETDARQVIHRLPGHLGVAQARHEKIFAAIVKKDEKAAQKMMSEAFSGLMKELKELES